MGILVECPKCNARGSTTRKVCKCGYQVQKFCTGWMKNNNPEYIEYKPTSMPVNNI